MREPAALPEDIRAHLEAENAYTRAAMADAETLRERLYAEMRGRIKEDDSSVPSPDGAFAYGIRFAEGAEHPMLVRTDRDGGNETTLLDANALAENKSYFHLGGSAHSPDHRLLAYATDEMGSEYFEIRIRDLVTGKDLADRIPGTSGAPVWAADCALAPLCLDRRQPPAGEDLPPHRRHRPVRGRGGVRGCESGLLPRRRQDPVGPLHRHRQPRPRDVGGASPRRRRAGARRLGWSRRGGAAEKYDVDHSGELFYILTNAGDAEDFKIVTAPVATPGREHWRDLVPHAPGRLILSITAYKDWLVRLEREGGLPRIVIRHLGSGDEHGIAFDEEAYSLGLLGGYEFDTTTLRFSYSSMTTPARVYDYDMANADAGAPQGGRGPLRPRPGRLRHPPASSRRPRTARLVPVSLLYRRGTPHRWHARRSSSTATAPMA